MTNPTSTLAAAKDLAGLGLAVFPVASDCRRPLTPHGYKDATTDPAEIDALWRRHPHSNVAVACGAASGVFVVDVDKHDGGADGLCTLAELEAVHGCLPATWQSSTPSQGRHLWFRQPSRPLRNRVGFAPGLDVRTNGGSVAAPPSNKPTGPYQWAIHPSALPVADAPDWLLDLIDPPMDFRPMAEPLRLGSIDRLANYAAAAINGECRDLAGMAPNTGRNLRLFQAAARLGELVGAGLVSVAIVEGALEAAAYDCGLVREDGRRAVLATIRSGLTRGMARPREVAA